MRRFLKTMVPGLLVAAVLTGSACAQGKIATIDMEKVFQGYYKTKQADAAIKERAADMDKEFKNMVSDFEKAKEEYQKVLAGLNDQAVSQEERDKRRRTAEDKLKYLRDQEETMAQYRRQASSTLDEQKRRMTSNLLGEIKVLITGRAKADGISMVLDSSAISVSSASVMLYNDNKNDITEDILKQLNAAAPPELLKSDVKKDESKPDEKKK